MRLRLSLGSRRCPLMNWSPTKLTSFSPTLSKPSPITCHCLTRCSTLILEWSILNAFEETMKDLSLSEDSPESQGRLTLSEELGSIFSKKNTKPHSCTLGQLICTKTTKICVTLWKGSVKQSSRAACRKTFRHLFLLSLERADVPAVQWKCLSSCLISKCLPQNCEHF